jgi:hypothetical protein
VNKAEIDRYFTDNWQLIQSIIKTTAPKCVTINNEDITSDIYLICIDKADRITNLNGFIRILASNIYRWERSEFNKNNKIVSNEIAFNDIYDDSDAITDEIYQQRMYALELYKLNAKPSQLRFIDLYFNKKIRTVEALKQELNISHRGAWTLIKDFKFKLKEYERKAELDEA